MFYLVKNKKIIGSSEQGISQEGAECLNLDISEEKIQKINLGAEIKILKNGEYKIIETEEYFKNIQEIEKQEKLNKIKEISELSANLRAKYLSAELLPDGEIKTATLKKLAEKTEPLSLEFQSLIGEFMEKYDENPLELIL